MVNDGEREGAKNEAGLYVYWLDGTWDAGRRVRRRMRDGGGLRWKNEAVRADRGNNDESKDEARWWWWWW
jgi:hypothetical protein